MQARCDPFSSNNLVHSGQKHSFVQSVSFGGGDDSIVSLIDKYIFFPLHSIQNNNVATFCPRGAFILSNLAFLGDAKTPPWGKTLWWGQGGGQLSPYGAGIAFKFFHFYGWIHLFRLSGGVSVRSSELKWSKENQKRSQWQWFPMHSLFGEWQADITVCHDQVLARSKRGLLCWNNNIGAHVNLHVHSTRRVFRQTAKSDVLSAFAWLFLHKLLWNVHSFQRITLRMA